MLARIVFMFCLSLLSTIRPFAQQTDLCSSVKKQAAQVTQFAADSLVQQALQNIRETFLLDGNEHGISFGKDATGKLITSAITAGKTNSGTVPTVMNAFADLHNHPNNLPPDAGDFYGLADINKNNSKYRTRLVTTVNGSLYALLITDTAALRAFREKYPQQPPAYAGGPPGFSAAIVDEAREIKYLHHGTDDMVLAFILDKYITGVCLLKQNSSGHFTRLITTVSKNKDQTIYSISSCP